MTLILKCEMGGWNGMCFVASKRVMRQRDWYYSIRWGVAIDQRWSRCDQRGERVSAYSILIRIVGSEESAPRMVVREDLGLKRSFLPTVEHQRAQAQSDASYLDEERCDGPCWMGSRHSDIAGVVDEMMLSSDGEERGGGIFVLVAARGESPGVRAVLGKRRVAMEWNAMQIEMHHRLDIEVQFLLFIKCYLVLSQRCSCAAAALL